MSDVEPEQDTPLEEPEQDTDGTDADSEEAAELDEEHAAAEPEPAPEQPSDEERVKAFKKIDGSFKTYQAAIERNLEDEVTDWLFCPLCAAGAIPGYVNRHDLGRVPEEVVANVNTFLGYARETDYAAAPGIVSCTDCEGLGKVSTGSRVPDHMTITCPTCKGYGYVPPAGGNVVALVGNGNGTNENAAALADLSQPERDNWGEPKVLPDGTLNGNYGKMPEFKQNHPVYGVTRNISPEELALG